jgi:TonB family protein
MPNGIPLVLVIALAAVGMNAATSDPNAQVIYAPRPEFPTESRLYHMSGNGVFVLRVQIRTGRVKDVEVERSTGWSILDSTAKRTLLQWRFRPGAENLPPIARVFPNSKDRFGNEDSLVKVPIHFLEFGGRTASFRFAHLHAGNT